MTGLEEAWQRLRPLPEGKCLLGLSGGADSVALLMMLQPLRQAGGLELMALHVNHGLRGEDADGDEAFARALCGRLEVPFRALRLDLGGRRDENAAREARYAAFRQVMAEEGISTLILAHQRDDQAETFLMRLMRGAGPEGLGGMRPAEEREGYRLLRPMLDFSGAELREMLRQAGIPWREDGSNRERNYLRNRIRLELIPWMEENAPGASGRLARTAEMIGRENDAMARAAEELLTACETPAGLRAETLLRAPEALRSRTLRLWWRREGPSLEERQLNYPQTLRLTALPSAPRGTIINLPGGWRARREKETVRLLEPGDRTRNNRPGGGKRKAHD